LQQTLSGFKKSLMGQKEQFAQAQKDAEVLPETRTYNALVKGGMSETDAYAKVQSMKADARPDTGAQGDAAYRKLIEKQQLGQPLSREERAQKVAYEKQKLLVPNSTMTLRMEGLAQMREYPVINKQTGELEMQNSSVINKSPGTYAPAGEGSKAMSKTALIEDIRGNIQQVRNSLASMPEFDSGMRAKVAYAMHSRDPRGSVNALLTGEAAKALTPEQQDYLINTALLVENAMAMRSVLGAGQGAEDLRSAITATIPGATTPSKGYAGKQLDQFEKVLNRLERGIPNVPLRPETGRAVSQSAAGTQQPVFAVNPKTKQRIVSNDGGQTWAPAQ